MQYPLPRVGSRSAVGCAVLNDKWVSATSGSEDHSFKCMRKNEYEEILRLCEDDRTDLDILLEYASSTVRGLQKLLKLLSKHGEVVVDDHISARHRGLILLIYSGCGLEVMESLLAEIRNLTAEKRKSHVYSFNITDGGLMPSVPDVTLEYPDVELHKIVHTILNCSVKEKCSDTELIGVVHAWKEFLEPMVGVQCDEWEDKELGQKLEDLGTEVRYSAPQGEGFNQVKYLEAEDKEGGEVSNGNYYSVYSGDYDNELKYSEADAREEGQVSPSLMAEEKFWDSDARHSTRALAEKPSSYCSAYKLIGKLVKQLKVMASDEMAIKLLALHTYERLHARNGIQDGIYQANARGLLPNESIYRFERKFKTGQLIIQLMEEPLKERVPIYGVCPKFAKKLFKFMFSKPRESSRGNRVFLRRNRLSFFKEDNQIKAFQNTLVANDLQLKICSSTYKVPVSTSAVPLAARCYERTRQLTLSVESKPDPPTLRPS
ncbi:hypothetical protein L7F22_065162 [Adiantum nelumboides]|nr:hypothetical protein [Adiantum nelumboides]